MLSNREKLSDGKTLDMAVRVLKPGGFRSFGPNLTVPCPLTDGCLFYVYLDLTVLVQLIRTGNKSLRL